ncbi:unnamed protein product [Linum trigynum]|uniref:Uncharacterized protein n=1 Tax=Linum trigynum TaxID=586398 RepID=A0AAV2GE72_9ROSI
MRRIFARSVPFESPTALNRDVVLTGKKKRSSHDIVSPPVEAGNQSDIVSSSSGKEKQCDTPFHCLLKGRYNARGVTSFLAKCHLVLKLVKTTLFLFRPYLLYF